MPKRSYKDKKEAIYKYMSKLSKTSLYIQPDDKKRFLEDANSEGKSFNRYALDAMEEHYDRKHNDSYNKAEETD